MNSHLVTSQSTTELMTPPEVAELMRVEVRTVHRMAAAGQLPVVLLPNGRRRFVRADVEALLSPASARRVA